MLLHGFLEERSALPDEWTKNPSIELMEVVENDSIAWFEIRSRPGKKIAGDSRADLNELFLLIAGRPIFIDLTGLSHHSWMPLLRAGMELGVSVRCIYAEPEKYQITNNPRPSEFFDLSERIRGISPIPSFAKLSSGRKLETIMVPLLGFEGTRFRYIVETLQPEGKNVYPVVGVPGFKPEYPFHAYQGNATTLDSTRAWENVRFADAACPFAVNELLHEFRRSTPNSFLQVPLIGTKPHALGAAMFALSNDNVELVYDHPVRKPTRTSGSSRCHVYYVSEYVSGR
ncbi:hypothetical protein NKG95_14990 [Mesorhizobium sp. M1423]|uniref:hypothetical protein n=1 Tax=Mesorhizobium sp. M1423 TaxID=2957101 RepID=UPI003335E084